MDKNRDALERVVLVLRSLCDSYWVDICEYQSLANDRCASDDELYELEVLKIMHTIFRSLRDNLIHEGGLKGEPTPKFGIKKRLAQCRKRKEENNV